MFRFLFSLMLVCGASGQIFSEQRSLPPEVSLSLMIQSAYESAEVSTVSVNVDTVFLGSGDSLEFAVGMVSVIIEYDSFTVEFPPCIVGLERIREFDFHDTLYTKEATSGDR